ncbi:hypothetical protein ACJX0J_017981, partial [Zea mays]
QKVDDCIFSQRYKTILDLKTSFWINKKKKLGRILKSNFISLQYLQQEVGKIGILHLAAFLKVKAQMVNSSERPYGVCLYNSHKREDVMTKVRLVTQHEIKRRGGGGGGA